MDTEKIAEFILDWYGDSPIDWDDALYRVETHFDIDLPVSMLHPTVIDIRKTVTKLRRN